MNKDLNDHELLEKAASFCAYQERSERDVLNRLRKWEVPDDKAALILEQLKNENFLNNRRFALAFARGRFRLKKWGRQKIRFALIQHGIEPGLVHEAIYSIADDQYLEVLHDLFMNRIKGLKTPTLQDKSKTFNFLTSRGFEYDLIRDCWDNHFG